LGESRVEQEKAARELADIIGAARGGKMCSPGGDQVSTPEIMDGTQGKTYVHRPGFISVGLASHGKAVV